MKSILFGTIDNFILFGGSKFLLDVAIRLKKKGYKVTVFSAKRHLIEVIDHQSLQNLLSKYRIMYYDSADINKDPRVRQHMTNKTIGLCFGAAWIFKNAFIRQFRGKLINFHGARLPQNRGAGGFTWQILRQNRLGYCLMHLIDAGVDTGSILKYREFLYPASCKTPLDFVTHYIRESIDFVEEFLNELSDNKKFELLSQPEYLSIYWPRLNTLKQGYINWDWSLKDIESFINAFDDPHAGASTVLNEKRVFLKQAFSDYNDGPFHPFQSGIVYRKNREAVFIAAKEGTLIVKMVLDEKNRNIIQDINLGDRLSTPPQFLHDALTFRPSYTPTGLKVHRYDDISQKQTHFS